jgi:glyoxylase-like metal-dependent hydrolase (beta-lactamase superfamily II)
MIFRQLFEPVSSTYCYLLACPEAREAVLIDPVFEEVDRYAALLAELGLKLVCTLETHVHADHVTGAAALRDRFGNRCAVKGDVGVVGADEPLADGMVLGCGGLRIAVIATPGHTDSCVSFLVGDRVFTGDALLIGGCGRTDFQQGSADRLYHSVTTRLFTLPPDTLVFPAHDYKGRTVSTIREEMATNARLGANRSLDEFRAIVAGLNLPYPKQIDRAVPANLRCGAPA